MFTQPIPALEKPASALPLVWDPALQRFRAQSLAGAAIGGLTAALLTFGAADGSLTQAASLSWDGSTLAAPAIKASGLTSGRVPYVTTAGLITDSAVLTFDGTSQLVVNQGGGTVPSSSGRQLVVARCNTSATNALFSIVAGNAGVSQFEFGDTDLINSGQVRYDHATDTMQIRTGGSSTNRITIDGTTTTITNAVSLSTASSGLTIAKTTGETLTVSSTASTCASFGGGATFGGLVTAVGVSASAQSTYTVSDASTAGVATAIIARHNSSGTPAANFGTGFQIQGQSDTTTNRAMSAIEATWVVATDASRTARVRLYAYDTAARECLRAEASGAAAMLGFLGASASVRTAVTGSRGGNAALAALLTELATKGLITDSTTV